MRKNWLVGAAILAAGLVTWNEYRLWTHRAQLAPLQATVVQAAGSNARTAYHSSDIQPLSFDPDPFRHPELIGNRAGEEECDATIIDLTALQRQTPEPPVVDTEEPIILPPAPSHTR